MNIWAHITCVNWTPEIWFTDDSRTAVDGKIDERRFKLFCYICRKKSSGSCLQCDYKDCHFAFHVRCAMEKDLIRDWEKMDNQRVDSEDYECFLFCDKHLEIG